MIFSRRLFRPSRLVLPATVALAFFPAGPADAQAPGTRDKTFFSGFDGYVYTLALRADGKIMVGGDFTTDDGEPRKGVTRINPNGRLDGGFNPGPIDYFTIKTLAAQPDGKVFVPHGAGPVRLNADGTMDPGYNAGTGIDRNGTIDALILQPDGKLILGGTFSTYNGVARNSLARLNADGSLDTGFILDSALPYARDPVLQADGKLLVTGFLRFNSGGTSDYFIARLNADGSRDTGFSVGAYTSERPYVITPQPDGKVLVGGIFTVAGDVTGGASHPYLVRFNADGTVDAGFTAATGIDQEVDCITLQPNGKIYIGGHFLKVGGVTRNHFARLNADGTLDTGFDPGTGADNPVNAIAVQPDGKVLVGGNFNSYNGEIIGGNRLVRVYGDPAPRPPFFSGEVSVGNGVYYLQLPGGTPFGYYSYLADPRYIYHFDLGYEYLFDAADGKGGVYLYDFKSGSFFYTSPGFPFPYLYDFSLNAVLYYYPDAGTPGRYTTNPRYFYNFLTGQIITK